MPQQPVFSRSTRRSRRYRLARTMAGVAVLVVFLLVVAKLFGGGAKEPPIAHVKFVSTARGESDGKAPAKAVWIHREVQKITGMLDDWYQTGFVDVKGFGDGTFPKIADDFVESARATFTKDIPDLTIGDARNEVKRVTPQLAKVTVTVFFADGKDPKFAVAHITFRARGKMKDPDQLDIQIEQTAKLQLMKQGSDWKVAYFDASETQDSIEPTPKPTN